jgi:hypothetical protein
MLNTFRSCSSGGDRNVAGRQRQQQFDQATPSGRLLLGMEESLRLKFYGLCGLGSSKLQELRVDSAITSRQLLHGGLRCGACSRKWGGHKGVDDNLDDRPTYTCSTCDNPAPACVALNLSPFIA